MVSRTRLSKSLISLCEKESCKLSIGTLCTTGANFSPEAFPPTFCVGEFVVINSGYSASIFSSSRRSLSYSKSSISGESSL